MTFSFGMLDGKSWSKYWIGQNSRDEKNIALLVYSDFDDGKRSATGGGDIYGSGYQERDGIVVTFAMTGDHLFIILDKYFDLRKGSCFHVYQKSPGVLAVQQEGLPSPFAQKIIASF